VLAFPIGEDIKLRGVTIHRCTNPFNIERVPIGFSARKVLLDATLLGSFERLLRNRRYDVVHAVEEAAYIASLLCRRHSRPYIYDMASSIPAELLSHKILGHRLAQRALHRMERNILRSAAHVVCSIGLGQHVRKVAGDVPYTEWRFPAITGSPDWGAVEQLRSDLDIKPDSHVVMYSGNFARYQGMDLLMDAFSRAAIADPSLLLVCVGASDEAREGTLKKLARYARERIRILTRRPRSAMPDYFALADCLISLRPISNNLPLKVFDYMATGKPIVATRGPAHEPLLNHERAFLCDAHTESVAQAILEVFRSSNRAQDLAQSARLHAQRNYGWNRFVGLVDAIYSSVINSRRTALHALIVQSLALGEQLIFGTELGSVMMT
jgi:glycosyltransferase involved in cell wall biosynthesis